MSTAHEIVCFRFFLKVVQNQLCFLGSPLSPPTFRLISNPIDIQNRPVNAQRKLIHTQKEPVQCTREMSPHFLISNFRLDTARLPRVSRHLMSKETY